MWCLKCNKPHIRCSYKPLGPPNLIGIQKILDAGIYKVLKFNSEFRQEMPIYRAKGFFFKEMPLPLNYIGM
jgi:hypothetical protein